MTDSRQYPLVVMTEAEEATVARFGIGARFEAGRRHIFGSDRKCVIDHTLGRFALFVDATDTERIAEALNGGVTSVYVWRDGVTGAVVGLDQPPVGSPRDFDCCSGTGGHPNAHTGAQGVSVVPVPTRDQVQTELDRHEYAGDNLCECGDSWGGTSDGVVWTSETNRHISEALLALFSPVEGNTK